MEGSRIGTKESVVSVSLNTNDALFAEIADSNISTVPSLLKEKCREVEGTWHVDPHHAAFSKNRPISSDSSISEIAAYAGKVGTISELKESLQIHLEVRFFPSIFKLSDRRRNHFPHQLSRLRRALAARARDSGGGQRIGLHLRPARPRGKNPITPLAQHPIEEVLHYLLLYCAANRGLKPKELDALRREFLLVSPFPPFHAQNFGLQQLPLLGLLERAGLLAPRGSAPSFASVRSKMRLIRDDIDGSQRSDLK